MATAGGNIVDLTTRVVGGPERPVYAMQLELALAGDVDVAALSDRLKAVSSQLGVDCTLTAVDADLCEAPGPPSPMSVLPVVRLPDPVLKRRAAEVGEIDEHVRRLCADLVETMRVSPACVGLAAPRSARACGSSAWT